MPAHYSSNDLRRARRPSHTLEDDTKRALAYLLANPKVRTHDAVRRPGLRAVVGGRGGYYVGGGHGEEEEAGRRGKWRGMSRLDEGDAEPLGAGRGRNDGGVSRDETAICRPRTTGTRTRFRTEASQPPTTTTAFPAPASRRQISVISFLGIDLQQAHR